MRAASLVLAATLLGAPAPAVADGYYGVAYTATYGSAHLPFGADAVWTTGLSYREYGGFLGRILIITLAGPPKPIGSWVSTGGPDTSICLVGGGTASCHSGGGGMRYEPADPEELARWRRSADEWWAQVGGPGVVSNLPTEISIDWVSRSLGGDADGWGMSFLLRGGGRPRFGFRQTGGAIGIAAAAYDYQQVTTPAGSGCGAGAGGSGDASYRYIGYPMRGVGMLTRSLGLYLQLDNNILTYVMDQPSPARLGGLVVLRGLSARVELVSDNFNLDNLSLALEVGFAL